MTDKWILRLDDEEVDKLNTLLIELKKENFSLKERISYLEGKHKMLIRKLDTKRRSCNE